MEYNILITNDDGIEARGIRALAEVASEYGKVTVVAPEKGMSGKSHAITMCSNLYIRRIEEKNNITWIAVDATPVDCVKIAVEYLMSEKPTLVLSGVNHGSNSNVSVIYSGTMGAAREGALYSIPSIGFSLVSHDTDIDLSTAKIIIKQVLDKVLPNNNNPKLCLNVNIPTVPYSEIKGIKVCRQTIGYWSENFEVCTMPREYVVMNGVFTSEDTDISETDNWALKNNYVSIVPTITDFTDYKTLSELNYFSNDFRENNNDKQ